MTGYFTTSPSVCYCTTWGKLNQQNMRRNEQKYVKNIPTLSIVTWRRIDRF